MGISRSIAYYVPKSVTDTDLALMLRIDSLHLEHPSMAVRLLWDILNRNGFRAERRPVATLMARRGIEALYWSPRTTRPTRSIPIGCAA